jgi:multiple sugar transport system permease protein/raffinose/stachyose/melibiose transport system permease protein
VFDLGYPSAIASTWFGVILACVVLVTAAMRRRGTLEY